MAEYNPTARRSTVRFKLDPEERDDTPMALTPRNPERERGRSFQGNPSRSDGAAAPIRKPRTTKRVAVHQPGQKVTLKCGRCGWTKQITPEKIVQSYRGHYGYAHANLRLPEPYECRDAVVR